VLRFQEAVIYVLHAVIKEHFLRARRIAVEPFSVLP
jgi:hypothetical protein